MPSTVTASMKAEVPSTPTVLIAVQDYKGTIPAEAVADAISAGILGAIPAAKIVIDTVSDGGQGTLNSLIDARGGHYRTSTVSGALGDPTDVTWALDKNGTTAIIETANIVGYQLVPENRRDPMKSDTTGLGELILEALDLGIREFLIGVGGSSTNDGGTGAARRLGALFLDSGGRELHNVPDLTNLDRIDVTGLDPRLQESRFTCLCDGIPPLVGKRGASHLYGPQKGAAPAEVEILERSLARYGECIESQFGEEVLRFDMAGCAGGLAAGLKVFTHAELKLGIDYILQLKDLDTKIHDADLVIVGEGKTDIQTIYFKAPIGVAKRASELGKPVIAISATVGEGWEEVLHHGITEVWPVTKSDGSIVTESMIRESTKNLFAQITKRTDN
jgi:glycerate 2-kinase